MFGKCRKQLSEGNICMLINQCEKGLRCVWGRCNRAEAGAPGNFFNSLCRFAKVILDKKT